MASARKQAQHIQEKAQRRHQRAQEAHQRAHDALTKATDRRATFWREAAAPEIDRFIAVFARFADFEFADHDTQASPIFGAIGEARLHEMRSIAADAAQAAALGGISGGVVSAGIYGAVATWGTASTGTAIATLNGVALSNATLAAIGGGAISAGGGGMAAGTMLLSGAAALPLILVGGGVYWHLGKKELAKAKTAAAELWELAAKADADRARIERLRRLVERLAVAAELLTDALSRRLDDIECWPRHGSMSDHTPTAQAYLARTALIAETLWIVATTATWTPTGEPTPEAERAAAVAEDLLDNESDQRPEDEH